MIPNIPKTADIWDLNWNILSHICWICLPSMLHRRRRSRRNSVCWLLWLLSTVTSAAAMATARTLWSDSLSLSLLSLSHSSPSCTWHEELAHGQQQLQLSVAGYGHCNELGLRWRPKLVAFLLGTTTDMEHQWKGWVFSCSSKGIITSSSSMCGVLSWMLMYGPRCER